MLNLTKQTLSLINEKPFGILLFYADKCKYCEMIKPVFDAYAERYPNVQFAKIEMQEGSEYYLKFAELTEEVVYEEQKDTDGNVSMAAIPQLNEDGSPKMTKKVVMPSFYVHHIEAKSPENEFGMVGGFDGASEEELKAVLESISTL